jgi:hypothetical protein
MSTTFDCRHHGVQEHTYGAGCWRYCGCDGTVHMACDPKPAPAGTPRPGGWPVFLTWRTGPAPKLEDLAGDIEYDVLPPDHPGHRVARAWIAGPVKYPRPEDDSYPHPYRSAWNAKVCRFISVTQRNLDRGDIRPATPKEA